MTRSGLYSDFDEILERLRRIDAEEARLHREMIADMRELLSVLEQ